MKPALVLLTPLTGEPLARLTAAFTGKADVQVIATRDDLDRTPMTEGTVLLGFGTGVIVPGEVLARLGRPAYNVHAASPDFPGRDPHHHAIYRGANEYGATLHVMTDKVDAGGIVAVETFTVAAEATPESLLAAANEAALRLVERHAARLLEPAPMPALEGASWGAQKTTRDDLLRLSRVSPLIDETEFRRRLRAFGGGTHANLTTDLHATTFRIDPDTSPPIPQTNVANAFTEDAFRRLIVQLKTGGYRFTGYGETATDRHVIWRHDVDCSMHRAVRLAEIEAEEGVRATYFVNPHSAYYNLLEPEVTRLLDRLRSHGHAIGLHFDTDAYETTAWTPDTLEAALRRETDLLEMILGAQIAAVSWHNPDQSNLPSFDDDELGALANAYAERYRRDYVYCSDSNGYWRFKPMPDVIAEGHPRLHLLTHPEWWTPEPMPPSARIDRALLGRARKVRRDYDHLLARAGRTNKTD